MAMFPTICFQGRPMVGAPSGCTIGRACFVALLAGLNPEQLAAVTLPAGTR